MAKIFICMIVMAWMGVYPADAKSKYTGPHPIPPAITSITVQTATNISPNYLELAVYKSVLSRKPTPEEILSAKKTGEKEFTFKLSNVKQPLYVSLLLRQTTTPFPMGILELYLVEPGDNIRINIDDLSTLEAKITYDLYMNYSKVHFSGKGSAKFECRYIIDTNFIMHMHYPPVTDSLGNFSFKTDLDGRVSNAFRILNAYKKQIGEKAFYILKANFFATFEMIRLNEFSIIKGSIKKPSFLKTACLSYQEYLKEKEPYLPNYAKLFSSTYSLFILKTISIDPLKIENYKEAFFRLKTKYSGDLRDKILVSFLLKWSIIYPVDDLLTDALSFIKEPYLVKPLNQMNESISKGSVAYNFSLPDSSGKIVRLSDFKGKVVFIDFWFTGCGACLGYYKRVVSEAEKIFRGNPDVVFLTINVDYSRERWLKGLREGIYTSPEAINLSTNGEGSGHPITKYYRIPGYPMALLIDREGKIFNSSMAELNYAGVEKLVELINTALKTTTG